MAHYEDLTFAEMLVDPMILSLAKADGWSKAEFADEMAWAAQMLRRVRPDNDGKFVRTTTVNRMAAHPCCV